LFSGDKLLDVRLDIERLVSLEEIDESPLSSDLED